MYLLLLYYSCNINYIGQIEMRGCNNKNKVQARKSLDIPTLLVSIHFGFVISWLIDDTITPVIFGEALAEKSLYLKLGIVFLYTFCFSFPLYFVIGKLEKNILFLKAKLKSNSTLLNTSGFNKMGKKARGIYSSVIFRAVFILIVSLTFSFLLFGENLQAQWWIIDDHEYMSFMGSDGQLAIWEIPKTLVSNTEIGRYGRKPRYRPSYYILRLLETALWGNQPKYYYLTRILICSFFISICWMISKDQLGFLNGLLFSMAIMSFGYWADIYSRLGPSEPYVAFGISLFTASVYLYLEKNFNPITCWLLILLGTVIAVGSKENVLILIIPFIWLVINSILQKKYSAVQFLITGLAVSFCGWVSTAVILGIIRMGGENMYATNVASTTLKSVAINEIRTLPFSIIKYFSRATLIISISYILVIFGVMLISILQKQSSASQNNVTRKILLRCGCILFFIYLLFLSQRLFYIDRWPTAIRYDFPGKLGEMLTLFVLFHTCIQLLSVIKIRTFISRILRIGFGCFCIIIIFQNNLFHDLSNSAQNNVIRTKEFTSHIEQIQSKCLRHPEYPIIFQSYDALDFEPIMSVKYFLQAYQVKNPVFIYIYGYDNQSYPESSYESALAQKLENVSTNGGWIGFSPLENLKEVGCECFSIHFSGRSDSQCIDLGTIW